MKKSESLRQLALGDRKLSWLECLSNEAARVVRERGKDERAEGR